MPRYFTDAGPAHGLFLERDAQRAITVFDSLFRLRPVGVAVCIGGDVAGVARWRLVIGDSVQPGRWYVFGREFRPAKE